MSSILSVFILTYFCSKSYRYFHNLSYCMCQVKYFVMLLIVRFRYIFTLVLATMRCLLFLMEIYASLSKLQLSPSANESLQLCFSHGWFVNLRRNIIPKVWSEVHRCWSKKTESPVGTSCGFCIFFPLLLANSPGSEMPHFQSLGKRSCNVYLTCAWGFGSRASPDGVPLAFLPITLVQGMELKYKSWFFFTVLLGFR